MSVQNESWMNDFLNGPPVKDTLIGVGDGFKCPDIPFVISPCPVEWHNKPIQKSLMDDITSKASKALEDFCICQIEEYLGRKLDLVKDSPRISRVTYPDTPLGDFYLCIDGKSLGYLITTYRFSNDPTEQKMYADIRFIKATSLPCGTN